MAAGDRADVDDVAAARAAHDRQRGVRAVEQAEAVDVDHLAPLLGRRAGDGAEQHHAGVVDQPVEAAELLVRLLDEGVRLGLVADVGLDRDRLAAGAVDLLGQRVDAVRAAGGQADGGALGHAGQRRRLADPRRGAGDRDHFAFESSSHGGEAISK